MYFDRNISEIRIKKSEGSYSSCELKEEIYFSNKVIKHPSEKLSIFPSKYTFGDQDKPK